MPIKDSHNILIDALMIAPFGTTERLASFLKGVTAPWPLDCRLGHRRRSSPSTGLQRRGPTDVAEVAGDGTHGGLFP
jgi:hypothetical protein